MIKISQWRESQQILASEERNPKEQDCHSVHPLSAEMGGGPPIKFSKRGRGLRGPQLLEGVC